MIDKFDGWLVSLLERIRQRKVRCSIRTAQRHYNAALAALHTLEPEHRHERQCLGFLKQDTRALLMDLKRLEAKLGLVPVEETYSQVVEAARGGV